MNKENLLNIQAKLKYVFNDPNILKMALTHKSYANEHYDECTYDKYNERIEFLGDAILEHIISDLLYLHTPMFSEGQMTKMRAAIVCEESLSRALKAAGLNEYIYLGRCEIKSNGDVKNAIVADAFEAILGAIYIDGGYDIARDICLELLDVEIKEVLAGKNTNVDYKTKLQELLQKNGAVNIEYVLEKEEGPEHDKTFTTGLYFNDKKIGEGVGKSKKQAEQEAARVALENEEK